MKAFTDGDLSRALSLLPSPLFRQNDIYDIAVQLGFRKAYGQSLWVALKNRGLIVSTATPIGSSWRRFYWERVKPAMAEYEERTSL